MKQFAKYFALLLLAGGTGCTSPSLDAHDQANFRKMIEANNDSELAAAIGSRPLKAQEASCLLGEVLAHAKGPRQCYSASIDALLSKGAIPSEATKEEKLNDYSSVLCLHGGDIAKVMHSGCEKMIDSVVSKLSELQVAYVSERVELSKWPSDQKDPNEPIPVSEVEALRERRKFDLNVIEKIQAAADASCEKRGRGECSALQKLTDEFCRGKRPDACAIATELKRRTKFDQAEFLKRANENDVQIKQEAEERAKEAADASNQTKRASYAKSPQAILDSACEASEAVNDADKLIARENEISATSGIVNKANLYQFGQMKVLNAHDLKRLTAEYSKMTGHALSLKDCKTSHND